ncbi:PREDICTED: putative protein FAM90A24P-like [Chrysochloris asiatica]|uniref:Uncharacterized protein n=1 Tax=Chrysochloris asiatica TaxID=185453 RepID=A0A9B0U5X6_CHRAS|nr:PREDICTED: putative protein FAM90A24P-like [Chrysochloris asiatica]
MEREKEQRQEHERKALLQRFPKNDSTESCDYQRLSCRPMSVYTTQKTSVLDPVLTIDHL